MKKKTSIQITQETWAELNKERLHSKETFEDVLKRILKHYREATW